MREKDVQIIVDSRKAGVDELLLYKQGKRNGVQIQSHILSLMEKAREDERAKYVEALREIIEQCPNPKLPYGNAVNDIARRALANTNQESN